MKFKLPNNKRYTLISLLKVNSELNIFDEKLFLEYLELPIFNDSNRYILNKEQIDFINKNSYLKFDFYHNIYKPSNYNEKELIENYLIHFFRFDNVDYKKYENYFKIDYLKKIYYKTKYLLGEITDISNYFNINEINELKNKTILKIKEYNKEQFKIDEDIDIILDIKNINQLYIKIYEINTENYYLTNLSGFDNKLNIDGIIATFEKTLKNQKI